MVKTACWCGNSDLRPFGPDYAKCAACGTLVSQKGLSPDELLVRDDETDFYGKQYWLAHQKGDLGFPDISERVRSDLIERNLHWARSLLKYRLPPATTLELGCSHGSFVALMRQMGYDAVGIEMSPWVVEFGRQTFGVPVQTGPIEDREFQESSLDVIALMDVLEHLPDPKGTMRHCLRLLKPDGVLLIQTPQFREDMKYEQLVAENAPFLEQLKSDEHLYLFSERSATDFFRGLGADYLNFEPAIFSQYDMFFVVSCKPLQSNSPDEIEQALSTPHGRFAQAMLDLEQVVRSQAKHIDELKQWQRDCASQVETLTGWVHESRSRAEQLLEQVHTLTRAVNEARAELERRK